jgi:two-component system alkaline phosphatase synthesis response regulator PhoP
MSQFTLLIVDDEASIRDGLSRYLEDEPIRIVLAKNGNEGLQLAQLESPDLILLDLAMPEMTGLELLEHLQLRKLTIPVIIMTAYDSETNKDLVKINNRNDGTIILRKPVDPDEIVKIIRNSIK